MMLWESCVLWLGYPIQDGVWPDVSKHDNDGVCIGARWEEDSMKFDGVNDYADCGNHSSLNITDKLSMEVLIKPKAITYDDGLVGKCSDYNWNDGYGLHFYALDSKLGFFVNDYLANCVTTTTALTVGKWVHIVGTYDRQYLRIYRDAVLNNTKASTAAITVSTGPLEVGRMVDDMFNFDGDIALVRVYNQPLTAAQVREAYEQSYRLV